MLTFLSSIAGFQGIVFSVVGVLFGLLAANAEREGASAGGSEVGAPPAGKAGEDKQDDAPRGKPPPSFSSEANNPPTDKAATPPAGEAAHPPAGEAAPSGDALTAPPSNVVLRAAAAVPATAAPTWLSWLVAPAAPAAAPTPSSPSVGLVAAAAGGGQAGASKIGKTRAAASAVARLGAARQMKVSNPAAAAPPSQTPKKEGEADVENGIYNDPGE